MSTIVVVREDSSLLLSLKLLDPDESQREESTEAAEANCIARAIARRMDPEWRQFVAQEQFERTIASFSHSEDLAHLFDHSMPSRHQVPL
jgi:hypothetical protein